MLLLRRHSLFQLPGNKMCFFVIHFQRKKRITSKIMSSLSIKQKIYLPLSWTSARKMPFISVCRYTLPLAHLLDLKLTHIHIHTHVDTNTHIHTHVDTNTHTNTHKHTLTHARSHPYTPILPQTQTHILTYKHKHAKTYIHTQASTNIHKYVVNYST